MILNNERLDMRYNIHAKSSVLDDIIFESMGFEVITELAEELMEDDSTITRSEAEWDALVTLRESVLESMGEY
jgi:hypothetical protein